MSNETYYKVVGENLESGLIRFHPEKRLSSRAVVYRIGEWVKPKVGKLMVFDGFSQCQNFIRECQISSSYATSRSKRMRVFKCEVQNPRKRWRYFIHQVMGQLGPRKQYRSNGSYSNTIFVDAVKLVEEVRFEFS